MGILTGPVPDMASPAPRPPVARGYSARETPPAALPLSDQQRLHAEREARLEVESWFSGPLYRWTPFTTEYWRPQQPRYAGWSPAPRGK